MRATRAHSQVQIAGSIAEFGFANPELVDGDKVIVAGHWRVLATRTLGISAATGHRTCYFFRPRSAARWHTSASRARI
jgi:hypothetical protein